MIYYKLPFSSIIYFFSVIILSDAFLTELKNSFKFAPIYIIFSSKSSSVGYIY